MQLNTNLTILQELNGDFDRYIVLFHLSTGQFENTEAGKLFDEEKFSARFPGVCQKSPTLVLRSLNYSGHISLRAGNLFTVIAPHRFSLDDLSELPDPKTPKKPRLLKGCEALKHFNSPDFIHAWAGYEEVMAKKNKPRTANTTKLGAAKLLELSGGDEAKATRIVLQSMDGGWPGFFPLKSSQSKNNAAQYYD